MLVPKPGWSEIPEDDYTPFAPSLEAGHFSGRTHPYGVAVDLGTTHIRISLWDMKAGYRVGGLSGLNPQSAFGSDVLTRLTAAVESAARAEEIGRAARDAIGEGIREIAARKSADIGEIGEVVIVANTVMLALLTGKNYDRLLSPGNWVRRIDCRPKETGEWIRSWGLDPEALIDVVQPLGGFVGSDLLAGVLATGVAKRAEAALLIDFGANSEIALWNGKRLWVTSTAGGPAFEGSGISCGMPAEPGSIYRVKLNTESDLVAEVIGGGEAKGICGSGLVDIIASLVRAGVLNAGGRFTRDTGEEGYTLLKGRGDLTLKKQDVDVFQRAKGAVGAAVSGLMEKAGIRLDDLKRVFVCGAFGRYLDVANAQDVGLLPSISAEYVELTGNSALTGCEMLLFSGEREAALEPIRAKSKMMNMSMFPGYEDLFIENLYLRPDLKEQVKV